MDDFVTFKDIVYLVSGLILGLLLGIAIYWAPLGQFLNECSAIWDLVFRRYKQGDRVVVKAGVDMPPLGSAFMGQVTKRPIKMLVWHDEGIGWHHRSDGWVRARILHLHYEDGNTDWLHKVCHLDLSAEEKL